MHASSAVERAVERHNYGSHPDSSRQHIVSAQLGLLYGNTNLGVVVTFLATTLLAALQWRLIPRSTILGWWLAMALVSVGRYMLARRYRAAHPGSSDINAWRTGFVVGAGLAGAGWGLGGILLYPALKLAQWVAALTTVYATALAWLGVYVQIPFITEFARPYISSQKPE